MGLLTKPSHTIALCSLANLINSADRVIMPIAVVPMADHFHWDMHGQGWVLSSFSVGYMSSQVFGASAAKKYGGKTVLAVAVTLWSLCTFMVPLFAHSITALVMSRIFLGFGEGIGLPTIYHVFSHMVPTEERSRAFGYLVAFGSIGQTLAAVILPHLPWPWMFYTFGSLGFVWVFVWMCSYHDVHGTPDDEYVQPPKVNNTNLNWREFICHWPLWAMYMAHFSMNWSNYIIMSWLPTYMTRKLDADKSHIMFTAVPYVMNSLFGVAAGHFADSLISQKWTVLSVRRLMTSIGLLGPAIFLLLFGALDNIVLAMLCISISMGLSACNASGHLSNHAEVAPVHAAITFAISNTLATIPGVLCGPLTAELVVQSHGVWFPVFVLAAAVNFVGAIIYVSQSAASQVI